MTLGYPTIDTRRFQRRVLLNFNEMTLSIPAFHLTFVRVIVSTIFTINIKILKNESIAKTFENVSRKMEGFKNAFFFWFALLFQYTA